MLKAPQLVVGFHAYPVSSPVPMMGFELTGACATALLCPQNSFLDVTTSGSYSLWGPHFHEHP